MKSPVPATETERLKALYWYQILDTTAEDIFDEVTLLASQVCEAPIAIISLVDKDRQWFKSKIGLTATQTPRDISFCAHTIMQNDVLEIKDALKDERFATNPLVTTDPRIRFYAGAPIRTTAGHNLGSLCVLDRVPRELNARQKESLTTLSRIVSNLFKQRRYISELEQMLPEPEVTEAAAPPLTY